MTSIRRDRLGNHCRTPGNATGVGGTTEIAVTSTAMAAMAAVRVRKLAKSKGNHIVTLSGLGATRLTEQTAATAPCGCSVSIT